MSYKFSRMSKKHLSEAHPDLQRIFNEVIKIVDCRIIEGYRDKENQNRMYEARRSKLKWPKSKHNQTPSLAVDAIPYPVDWSDKKRFYYFAGTVMAVANLMGIQVRWGGDWDKDKDFDDQSFNDLPHFELVGPIKK